MGASDRPTRAAAAAAAMASGGSGGAETRGASASTAKRSARSRKTAPAAAAVATTTTTETARSELAAHEVEVKQQAPPQPEADASQPPPVRIKQERQPATATAGVVASSKETAASRGDETSNTATSAAAATAAGVVEDTTDMKPPSTANKETETGIPACLRVRIAASPPTVIAAASHAHIDDEDDDMGGELDDASEAALRIDAATSVGGSALRSNTSPTSVASAPTSPADDSGLNTPSSSEGSAALATAKRRRLEDPPMFLEKTYEMLEKCSPEIAGWSVPAGDSFIVKKPIEFAERVIPEYFKHRNFSSFVRQLNFYGFRKVRVDAETAASVDPKEWWEFRHDKFVRGRRDLLREIKRRTIADGRATIERAEMDELRAEVLALKEQVQLLNTHMARVLEALAATSSRPASGAGGSATRSPSASGRERHYQSAATQQQKPTVAAPQLHLPSMVHHSQTQLTQHHHHQQQLHHQHALMPLHQGLAAPVAKSSAQAAAAAVAAAARAPLIPSSIAKGGSFPQQQQMDAPPRSPVTAYQLRPLQSVVPSVHHLHQGATTATAGSHLSPVFTYRSGPGSAPAGMSFVDRVEWSRYVPPHHHVAPSQQQQQHSYESQSRFTAAAAAYPSGQERAGGMAMSSSTAPLRRAEMPTQHSLTGFKRPHDDFPSSNSHDNRSAGAMRETPPDAAVRQLSRTATQTRGELLNCIISRILGFIRIQQQQQPRSGEVVSVADAVASDIQQLLARVQEPAPPNSPAAAAAVATATTHATGNSEAACMYRVEILKFISRELPRAVQEAVEKRIPQQLKKHVNRSLLALLVQKAQAALEHQMRLETAPSAAAAHSVSAVAASSGAMMHR